MELNQYDLEVVDIYVKLPSTREEARRTEFQYNWEDRMNDILGTVQRVKYLSGYDEDKVIVNNNIHDSGHYWHISNLKIDKVLPKGEY